MRRSTGGSSQRRRLLLLDDNSAEPEMPSTAQNLENWLPALCESAWADLPVLDKVFDYLTDVRDIAACVCVCKSWAEEGARDHRWRAAWGKQVSDQGLWRWARAEGGYREQLRANAVVRKGTSFFLYILFYAFSNTALFYQLSTDTSPRGPFHSKFHYF